MDVIDSIERNSYTIELRYDEFPENPRAMFDHIAVLTQLSDRFIQPDSDHDERIVEAWNHGRWEWAQGGRFIGSVHSAEKVERYARAFLGAIAVGWIDDPRSSSRIFGYLTADAMGTWGASGLVTPDEVAQTAQRHLNAELAEYAAWSEGDVYVWVVLDSDGEVVESCGGYYGDAGHKDALAEAALVVDARVAARHSQRLALFRRLVNG